MMRLVPFALVNGAVVHPSVSRRELVEQMAKDLVRFEAFNNENDAIRSLMWTQRYSAYDIVVLAPNACQRAFSLTCDIVGKEMGRS